MNELIRDLRYGLRHLRRNPTFTVIALLSLALGIGANTAIFSLVNTVLLRPLPVANPDQIVAVYGTLHDGADDTLFSYLNYKDYRDRNKVFSGLTGYRFAHISLSRSGVNESAWGYMVSGNYFDVLGIKAALGRTFLPEEDSTPNSHPVVVLSYGTWQKRFGGDPNIVGSRVMINGHPFTIIGVAPKGFNGTEVAYEPALWTPFMMAPQVEPGSTWLTERDSDNIFVLGRLKPGITRAQADASLKLDALELQKEYPKENTGRGVKLQTPGLFLPEIRESVTEFAAVLMFVVGLLLLLACVNLANLLLARAVARRKEIAVRLALGASRLRLVRQLVTESVMLSVAGGALGLLLALWIDDIVAGIRLPTDIALIFDLRLDWHVLIFAFLISVAAGILFGLLPALQSSKSDLASSLKDEGRTGTSGSSRLRNTLVVAQVALSLILLVCAGLIVRSLQHARRINPGFNPENAVSMVLDLGIQGYDEARGRSFEQQLTERLEALPGIKSASLVSNLPLALDFNSTAVYIEGQPFISISKLPLVVPNYVAPHYFQTMEIPLRGRDFTIRDRPEESRVAIVNETFARHFYPGEDAIGKRFNFTGPGEPFWEIIGISADGKYNSLGEDPQPLVYRPLLRDYNSTVTIVARTEVDPHTAISEIRGEINRMDPNLALFDVKTLTEHMAIPLFPARVAASVLGSFGVLALLLAALGVFGVVSFAVSQRTREIGIRMALGARPGDVLTLIIGRGMFLTLIGAGAGLVAALLVTRALSGLLYGISPTDPMTFAGVALLLLLVAMLASYIPARRATKIDPMIALRHE